MYGKHGPYQNVPYILVLVRQWVTTVSGNGASREGQKWARSPENRGISHRSSGRALEFYYGDVIFLTSLVQVSSATRNVSVAVVHASHSLASGA